MVQQKSRFAMFQSLYEGLVTNVGKFPDAFLSGRCNGLAGGHWHQRINGATVPSSSSRSRVPCSILATTLPLLSTTMAVGTT